MGQGGPGAVRRLSGSLAAHFAPDSSKQCSCPVRTTTSVRSQTARASGSAVLAVEPCVLPRGPRTRRTPAIAAVSGPVPTLKRFRKDARRKGRTRLWWLSRLRSSRRFGTRQSGGRKRRPFIAAWFEGLVPATGNSAGLASSSDQARQAVPHDFPVGCEAPFGQGDRHSRSCARSAAGAGQS